MSELSSGLLSCGDVLMERGVVFWKFEPAVVCCVRRSDTRSSSLSSSCVLLVAAVSFLLLLRAGDDDMHSFDMRWHLHVMSASVRVSQACL